MKYTKRNWHSRRAVPFESIHLLSGIGYFLSDENVWCVWCAYYSCNQPGGEPFAAIALAVGTGKTPKVP
jgi:hypothetical protein